MSNRSPTPAAARLVRRIGFAALCLGTLPAHADDALPAASRPAADGRNLLAAGPALAPPPSTYATPGTPLAAGSGWVAGNIVRLNTIGALKGFSCIRAVQPGDYTALEHSFTLLPRIDVDRPPSS